MLAGDWRDHDAGRPQGTFIQADQNAGGRRAVGFGRIRLLRGRGREPDEHRDTENSDDARRHAQTPKLHRLPLDVHATSPPAVIKDQV